MRCPDFLRAGNPKPREAAMGNLVRGWIRQPVPHVAPADRLMQEPRPSVRAKIRVHRWRGAQRPAVPGHHRCRHRRPTCVTLGLGPDQVHGKFTGFVKSPHSAAFHPPEEISPLRTEASSSPPRRATDGNGERIGQAICGSGATSDSSRRTIRREPAGHIRDSVLTGHVKAFRTVPTDPTRLSVLGISRFLGGPPPEDPPAPEQCELFHVRIDGRGDPVTLGFETGRLFSRPPPGRPKSSE